MGTLVFVSFFAMHDCTFFLKPKTCLPFSSTLMIGRARFIRMVSSPISTLTQQWNIDL
tara:strand:- start:106 stop:279 length:174 start_codon:yes stop_codon:yes gene_type:complete